MPRIIDPAKINHAAELYASGKTFKECAAELSMDPESLRVALRRRGIEARPRTGGHNRIPAPEGIADAYRAGESVKALAAAHGVARAVVRRWLIEAGEGPRGRSEAMNVRQGRMSPAERSNLARAAHDAVRGVEQSEEHRRRIALSRELSGYGGPTSAGTDWLCRELAHLGIEHIREKAVGRYNLDIALSASSVAVEVLGGNWHRAKPVHTVRTPYILNAGWHVVFVWDTKRCKISTGALDYIITFAEKARLDPTATREYRVIRGDGEFVAAGSAEDDEFPLIPASVRNLRRRTVDQS